MWFLHSLTPFSMGLGGVPEFLNCLPTGNGGFVPLEVVDVPERDWGACCADWDRTVGEALRQIPSRPDSDWNWRLIAKLLRLGRFRRPRLLQLRVGEKSLPAAMVALLERERWFDGGGLATFVWYLSTAPSHLLQVEVSGSLGVPKLVGRAAIDAAMVVSATGEAGGKLWLHADPRGVDLMLWYGTIPGLTRISERQFSILPGPPLVRRRNDGRYFAAPASTSQWTLVDMDHLRQAFERGKES